MEKVSAQWKSSSLDLGSNLLKRTMDVLGSLLLIIVLSPILLIIAYLIHRDGGSCLYSQERVGYGGRVFKCLKFRSMVVNSKQRLEEVLATCPIAKAEWEKDFKLKNDPRVTPIGGFLRKTSLDELPQLFNVVQGSMSLVGPRPHPPPLDEKYKHVIPALNSRYAVKPGITGWAQINYPYGASIEDSKRKLSYDLYYIKNLSWALDLHVMLRTVGTLAAGSR